MAQSGMKKGEKILFGVVAVIGVFALTSFILMEVIRSRSEQPMYQVTTHYDFSAEGLKGSTIFREKGCTACHRAVRNGTNMGLDLDGIGSRRTFQYLIGFLKDPEATYAERTIDHGPKPKEAAYVMNLPEDERHSIAVFLSELKATQGSAAARVPPQGRSGFVDEMVKVWAPDTWKSEYHDVREEIKPDQKSGEANAK